METATQVLQAVLVLGLVIEGVVEVLVASWIEKIKGFGGEENAWKRELALKGASAIFGVVGCLVFGLDLVGVMLALFGIVPAAPGIAGILGQVLSGVMIARGAQWLHDFGTKWLGLDNS